MDIVTIGEVLIDLDPFRTATLDAAACAKKLSAVITYDPNYRPNLWKNKEDIETTDARYSAIQIHQ